MFNRLLIFIIIAAMLLYGCGPDLGGAHEQANSLSSGERLRIVAANLSSGTRQSYTPGEGLRILQGVAADVVLIQEFNVGSNTAAELQDFAVAAVGPEAGYCREGGAQIPNGIISRFPIVACGEWDDPWVSNRDFSWARIDLPGDQDLWAVSVHLLTSSSTTRNAEAQSLMSLLQGNVPAGAWLVVGGDLNTGNRGELAVATLGQRLDTAGPYPADRFGNANTNSTRARPYDWVLASPELAARSVPVEIGGSQFPSGLVADTRVYDPIAEIAPALSTDSAAVGMQHMGVVRDFLLPSDPAPAPAQMLINEVLANEPGSSTAGEFVELLNAGGSPADLGGWTLSDAAGVRHLFPASTIVGPGRTLVVYGGSSGIPPGLTNVQVCSTGTLHLVNGTDSVTLSDTLGAPVDGFAYGSAGSDGVSFNRNPDGVPGTPLVPHTQLSTMPRSPGARIDGSPF